MRPVPIDMANRLRAAANGLLGGLDDLQMQDVATAAGVARSSLYYYFENKDDVVAFLCRTVLEDLVAATATAVGSSDPAPLRLEAVIRAQLEHLSNYPAASQLLIANLGRAGQLPEIAAQINLGFEEPVRQLLAEGAAEGSLRGLADDTMGATALFGAVLVIGLRALVVEGQIDVDAVIAKIGPMFWNGIAPEGTATFPGV